MDDGQRSAGGRGRRGGSHEVPGLVEDGLDVLAAAGQLALVVRVGEDAAVREDDVLADLGYLGIDLHLLPDLNHVQELGREGDGDRTHVGQPQHAHRGYHVHHRAQGSSVHRLLDVLLVGQEGVFVGCEFGVVLVSVEGCQPAAEVLPEPALEVRVGAVKFEHFPGSQNGLHYYLIIISWLISYRLLHSHPLISALADNLLYVDQYYIVIMEQQLILSTIEILPATMEEVLGKLQALLASPSIEQEAMLGNIIKSLFFGVWNFDKMINQHNLNTKIAELLLKLPKKNAILFLRALLKHLYEKWNLIDHHRINKFMQLVRYLLAQSFKFSEKHKGSKKRIDEVLHECVFDEKLPINGLVFHVIDIYFELCKENISQAITLEDLGIFEELLVKHSSEHVRLYIAEHVYEKYKDYLIQTHGEDLDQLEEKIQAFAAHFLELARKEEKQLHRKNLYSIVGYAKSEEISFSLYIKQKREKALLQQQKKKKKLTKAKKQQIRKLKDKRKEKKKGGKKTKKIMSAGKFQAGVRAKKGIEEL